MRHACRWPKWRWRQDSAASDASTKSSNGSLAVRHVLCGASPPATSRPEQNGEVTILLGYRPHTTGPRWSRSSGSRHPGRRGGLERSICAHDRDRRGARRCRGGARLRHALRVAIRFSRLSALPTIIARVRRVFDLAADPQAVNAQLAEDPILAPLVAARPGLRSRCVGWVRARRSGRARSAITVAAGVGLVGKLVTRCGAALAGGLRHEGLTHVFPRPEQWRRRT